MCADKLAAPIGSVNGWSPKFTQGLVSCGQSFTSTNIEKECKSNSDCPTSSSSVKAECSCRYDMSGVFHCGAGNGDSVYMDYIEKVMS